MEGGRGRERERERERECVCVLSRVHLLPSIPPSLSEL